MDHTTQQQPDHVQWEIDLLGNIDPAIRLRSAMELGRLQAAGAASALVERLGLEREFFIRETPAPNPSAGDSTPVRRCRY